MDVEDLRWSGSGFPPPSIFRSDSNVLSLGRQQTWLQKELPRSGVIPPLILSFLRLSSTSSSVLFTPFFCFHQALFQPHRLSSLHPQDNI